MNSACPNGMCGYYCAFLKPQESSQFAADASVTADTASDGVALGRSTDSKYTFLRLGFGAFMLLPIKGGFTVIQLITMYLVYMGIGLGSFAWTKFSNGYLSTNGYVGSSEISSGELYNMRGEFGRAAMAKIAGNLRYCI